MKKMLIYALTATLGLFLVLPAFAQDTPVDDLETRAEAVTEKDKAAAMFVEIDEEEADTNKTDEGTTDTQETASDDTATDTVSADDQAIENALNGGETEEEQAAALTESQEVPHNAEIATLNQEVKDAAAAEEIFDGAEGEVAEEPTEIMFTISSTNAARIAMLTKATPKFTSTNTTEATASAPAEAPPVPPAKPAGPPTGITSPEGIGSIAGYAALSAGIMFFSLGAAFIASLVIYGIGKSFGPMIVAKLGG